MINKTFPLFILGICLLCYSCSSTNDINSEEVDRQELITMLDRINEIALSVSCNNPDNWQFTAYGSKPCGGPIGYIAYSNTIDTTAFLQLIKEHKLAEKEFNEKQGLMSDCSVPAEPSGIKCENDKAVLVYP